MPTASAHPILREGPYLPPPGPARRNAELLFMLLPAVILTILARSEWLENYQENSLDFIATLAAAGIGILTAPSRRRALRELDWAAAGAVFWLLISFHNLSTEPSLEYAPFGGLLCGLLAARPRWRTLLAAPALIPFLALGIMAVFSMLSLLPSRVNPIPEAWTPHIFVPWFWGGWGRAAVPVSLVLLSAGLGHAAKPRSRLYLLGPWLIAGLLFSQTKPVLWGHMPGLIVAAGLVAPYLSRSFGGLVAREALIGLFLLSPSFQLSSWLGMFIFFDPRPFAAVLVIALPEIWPSWRDRSTRPATPASAPPATPARPRLLCGHRGRAAQLAEWAGLASCRLAAAHDDGFLLCPYGCLGLGDCVRACPHGAVRLEDSGFPAIDESLCQGCGRCREVCPKSLFEPTEGAVRAFIPCLSASPLKKNADYCPRGCLGCGRCRKACPAGAIGREGHPGALRVDQDLCQSFGPSCGRACAAACPRRLFGD